MITIAGQSGRFLTVKEKLTENPGQSEGLWGALATFRKVFDFKGLLNL